MINKKQIIKLTAEYIKRKTTGEATGHDWWHTYRVWKNAVLIGKHEKVDLFVVELSALLHDIADYKNNNGDDQIGPKSARIWLSKFGLDEKTISQVCGIVAATYYDMNFKNNKLKDVLKSKEAEVVWDADKLDATGAMGVARNFTYGGSINREIYNPEIKPKKIYESFEQYKYYKGTTINHFYEKTLLLKDLMNTKTAKKIANKRHEFIKNFLEEFFKEWQGKI